MRVQFEAVPLWTSLSLGATVATSYGFEIVQSFLKFMEGFQTFFCFSSPFVPCHSYKICFASLRWAFKNSVLPYTVDQSEKNILFLIYTCSGQLHANSQTRQSECFVSPFLGLSFLLLFFLLSLTRFQEQSPIFCLLLSHFNVLQFVASDYLSK